MLPVQISSSVWRVTIGRLQDDFRDAAKEYPKLRHAIVQALDDERTLPPGLESEMRVAGGWSMGEMRARWEFSGEIEKSASLLNWLKLNSPEKLGYLFGDPMGRQQFEHLAERSWLTLPGSTEGKNQAYPQPRPVERWMAFVYQQLDHSPSSYLSAEDVLWVADYNADGQLVEHRYDPSAVREGNIVSTGYPDACSLSNRARRWVYTALATDPFTVSAVAIDLLLADPDPEGPYLVSIQELDAYQKSPAFQNANFLVDYVILANGKRFPIYRRDCKAVPGTTPSICPSADPKPPVRLRPDGEMMALMDKRFRDLHLVGDGETIHWIGRQATVETTCICGLSVSSIASSGGEAVGKVVQPVARGTTMSHGKPQKGSCASFGLLWLTDLHFGQSAQTRLWPIWEDAFFTDLEHLHEQSGPWDAILFTGDLVFSGKKEEFNGLTDVMTRLRDMIASKQSTLPCFLSVPGNHDLQRPVSSSSAASALRHYWDDEITMAAFWDNSTSDYRDFIKSVFAPYSDWSSTNIFRAQDIQRGILPGDFATTIESDHAKLGIVGLNTTYLQLDGSDYQGRLDVDLRQLQSVCHGNVAAWAKQHHACILLTHHPISWLAKDVQNTFLGGIYPSNRFAGHFFGHMHERTDTTVAYGGALPRHHFQGCSLFGLERFGEAFTSERPKFGYAVCRIELDHEQGSLFFWPREARKQQSGDLRLVPDTAATLVRGTDYYGPLRFSLNQSCDKATTVTKQQGLDDSIRPAESALIDPVEIRRTAQIAIDQTLKELEDRRSLLPPADYLREIGKISADLANLGERRKAWQILRGPFDRERRLLLRDERVTLGLQLVEYQVEDKNPEMAVRVLNELLTEADELPSSDPNKARFWQLQARCAAALSAYLDAVKALNRAIEVTSDPQAIIHLQAELAELHLLNGNLEQALITAESESNVHD
ncbi:MAG TPA: metallophosphoesterase [Gemmataceae bacterium]|nr:metallophosphoesterase [Gemmataceae bacterium]